MNGMASESSVQFDLAIVGAGPAGMAAAIEGTRLGLSVVVFDEQPGAGGQIFRGIESASGVPPLRKVLGRDYLAGLELAQRFRSCGAEYLSGAEVSYVTDDLQVATLRRGLIETRNCRALLVATGALERPFPIPGWTLPGVLTAGGVQTLLKSQALVPEGRVVIVGTGPLTLLVAAQLLAAGVDDLSVLDTTPRANLRAAAAHLLEALGAPAYLLKGLRMLAAVRRGARRHLGGVTDVQLSGDAERVRGVQCTQRGRPLEFGADWVILHQGVMPNTQLTRALGCAHTWDDAQLAWRPTLDERGASSRAGVWVAGDSGGIIGGPASAHSGRWVAAQIAVALGKATNAEVERSAAQARAALTRHHRIRPFLDRMYRPADAFRRPVGDTIVCRCEDVSARALQAALDEGCPGPNQLKFFTRCGMGPCQGRYCGSTVSEMVAASRAIPVQEAGHFRIRQPLKPIPLGALATVATPVKKAERYAV